MFFSQLGDKTRESGAMSGLDIGPPKTPVKDMPRTRCRTRPETAGRSRPELEFECRRNRAGCWQERQGTPATYIKSID